MAIDLDALIGNVTGATGGATPTTSVKVASGTASSAKSQSGE